MRKILTERYKALCDKFEAHPTQSRAIKLFCLMCCCCDTQAIKECSCKDDCPLFRFRPFAKHKSGKKMTDEQKIKAGERMQRARDKKNLPDQEVKNENLADTK